MQTGGEVLLKTATVFISGPAGTKKAICLFDDGSQRSYIRKGLAEELCMEVAGRECLSRVPTKRSWQKKVSPATSLAS